MNVLDSSALAKFVNRERGWEEVERALEGGCVTLELALKEVANSLWRRVMRGDVEVEAVRAVMKDLIDLKPFRLAPQEELYSDALALASEAGIPIYDSLFIQLAKRLGTLLLTSDRDQAKAAEAAGVKAIIL